MQKVQPHEFEAIVKSVHNHLYANANVRTNEAIAKEAGKILLSMIHASKDLGSVQTLSRSERDAAMRGDPALVGRLSADVSAMFDAMQASLGWLDEGGGIGLDEASVAFVRAAFDGILFTDTDRDWLGDAMEVFRSLEAKRLGGQFFTDQRVTDLAVELLDFDPRRGDDFIDICAGTGGFLLAAARAVDRSGSEVELADTLLGVEVDPELGNIAEGSLSLHVRNGRIVYQADSLASTDEWHVDLRRRLIPGTHRCLASNPPFGQKITIKDESTLRQYDLGHRWSRQDGVWHQGRAVTPKPPDILFVERNLSLLEPGVGRLALVTPYQILSGPQLGYVREWILRHALVRAIIDLPPDTFQPWTGTKTSLMVLERRRKPLDTWNPEHSPYDIFMAVSHQIGHDRRGKPVLNGNGEILTDLPAVGESFTQISARGSVDFVHSDAFLVSSTRLSAENDLRLNAAFHNPINLHAAEMVERMATDLGWGLARLGEVVDRIFFPARFKRNYVAASANAVPFLGGSQINELIPTNCKYLSEHDPKLGELLVEPGWLLITRSGSTGIVSSVPECWAGYAMSEHIIRVVPNRNRLDPLFLEAYLRSSIGQQLLRAGIFGSVIDEITPEHVATIPVPLPKPHEVYSKAVDRMSEGRRARDQGTRGIVEGTNAIEDLFKAANRVAAGVL